MIYFCSPLAPQAGDPGWPIHEAWRDDYARIAMRANTEFAEQCCREIALAGGTPFAPHLLFPRFLDDRVPAERNLGIKMALDFMPKCAELWARLPEWRTENSRGMKGEIVMASEIGVPPLFLRGKVEWERALMRLSIVV